MSDSDDDYGKHTGRWANDEIQEFRQRELDRDRYMRVSDLMSLTPRSTEEQDWLKYRAKKKRQQARAATESTARASSGVREWLRT